MTHVASGFADRSVNKDLVIPNMLSSNLDKDVLEGGILCDTFATASALLESVSDRKVLIWGCGYIGNKVFDRISCMSNISAMIDNNESIQGTLYRSNIPILSPEMAYEIYPDAVIILEYFEYADKLRLINRKRWHK